MGIFDSIRRVVRRRAILKQTVRLRAMTVRDVMTKYVISVNPEDDVVKAATKMIAEDISCLVALDKEKPVGVVSERDFLRKVPLSKAVFAMQVKDIMSDGVISVPSTMLLTQAASLMKDKHIRRLVVLEDGKMLGVITQTDFTRTLSKMYSSYPLAPTLSCENIMSKAVVTVEPSNSVAEAKQKMLKNDVGAIVIMEKGQPVGIFTEYDIVMQFYDQHGKLVMNDISKYMRKYVRAVPKETSVFAANKLMLEKNMRRLLIVDDKKVVGIVTQTDICRFMYTHLDELEKATREPKADLRRFSLDTEIHGEFKAEHLKVYELE